MKIACSVCVVNRQIANLTHMKKKHVKSTLALCKHPSKQEFCLILFTGQNKNGMKYPVNGNIKQILKHIPRRHSDRKKIGKLEKGLNQRSLVHKRSKPQECAERKVLTRFLYEGKCTIQIKKPEHDLCIQSDVIQLKGFLHLLKRALEGKISEKELTFSSMAVTPVKRNDIAPIKLEITKRSEYPSKGFPRTLEVLHINNISRCGLDRGILQLHKLRVLDLSQNLIEFLPQKISNLTSLKELNLSNNLLGRGSLRQWSWIGGCLSKTLLSLDLSHNNLVFVPDQIAKLYNLTTLNLNNNKLRILPSGIGNLRNLRIFSASNNAITVLPGSVEKLRLQSIDMSNNSFEQIVPNAAGIYPKSLPVCSLKEYASKKVLCAQIPYPPGSIPTTLIDFLDHGKYCVCGKACFSVFIRHSHNLLLSKISETVNSSADDSIYVPIDCYFCSVRCFSSVVHSRNRNPIVR